ncbi:beta-N-acetylhexosaminidase [Chimaeribacter arupi]|uniref:beta-N-acetylhexosaminidase n=1 Tax=Chimaeribacter arupi TaxID=2060066 RepID=UPI000C7D41F9|nr:beta-N-acetylhexosaminidase [Chimaeribacter arupi]
MKTHFLRTTLAATVASLMVAAPAQASQQTVDDISRFTLNYQIEDNQANRHGTDCRALGADWASCNTVTLTLTNPGEAVNDHNWAIYFHSIRQVLQVTDPQFSVTRLTGDLHRLTPTAAFKGFPAGGRTAIPMVVEYWQVANSDIMPRWYVTADDAEPKIIRNTDTEDVSQFVGEITPANLKRAPEDNNIAMTPDTRFVKNRDVAPMAAASLRGQIIPTPLQVKINKGDVLLNNGLAADLAALPVPSQQALRARMALLGLPAQPGGYPLRTRIDSTAFSGKLAVAGAYRLTIGEGGADVVGFDHSGVFYGVQSLLSLVPVEGEKRIAQLTAADAPRFPYRGMHVDVGRNFHSKAAVLRLLDEMAAYKLNTFQFHLTDDEGWRIEIPGLPELTEIGSKRCHDLTETRCLLPQLGSGPYSDNNGSGYFSRADYIEIVKYAQARQINVIPEIDMPAHARAAIVSMEARYQRLQQAGKPEEAGAYRLLDPTDTSNTTSVQYYDRRSYLNPCLPSSLRFVDKVVSEIAAMHQEAGQPLTTWHFGGDEAKNIRLGPGYQDLNAPADPAKGAIDLSKEDQPWSKSTVCQALVKSGKVAAFDHLSSYFAVEVSKLVKARGIDRMQAWQDGLKDAKDARAFATSRVGVNFWDTLYWGGAQSAGEWAAKGYEITLSNPDYLYFDKPYEVSAREPGYYWATRASDEAKIFSFAPDNLPQNAETSVDRDGNAFTARGDAPWPGAHGMSGQAWSETIRTDSDLEYRIYPRLMVLAERAWHRADWELPYKAGREYQGGKTHWVNRDKLAADWQRFANLMGQREIAKLDRHGVAYRLPVPGARIVNGKLDANVSLPGLTIQYSQDGVNWQTYRAEARPGVEKGVWVRTLSPDGKRSGRSEQVGL